MSKIYKIRKQGGSRIIAISSIIPDNWEIIEMKTGKKTKEAITVIISKVR